MVFFKSFIRVNFLSEETGEVARAVRALEIGRDRPVNCYSVLKRVTLIQDYSFELQIHFLILLLDHHLS